jgi:hypothetical protein
MASRKEIHSMPARVDELARKLIEQHGTSAVYIAVERLNQSIDERDHPARDFWAQVVHAIHEYQRPVPGLRRAAGEPSAVRRRRKADRVT